MLLLLRRQNFKRRSNLLLPLQLILSINFRTSIKLLQALRQQSRAQDQLVFAKSGLVVVYVGSAVLAIVAMHRLARISGVCVVTQIVTFRDLQRAAWDDLVEREGAAGKHFACVAVAQDVLLLVLL